MRIGRTLRCILALFGVFAVLVAAGCAAEYERSEKPAGDFSRALLLGESNIKQPVALQVDPEGRVHLAWTEALAGEQEALHYAQIDAQGQVVVDRAVPTDLTRPRSPQLVASADGRLHLGVLIRQGGEQMLLYAQVDSHGAISEPVQISRDGEDVASFQMIRTETDGLQFLWAGEPDSGQSGIYRTTLLATGPGAPELLVPRGADPFVLTDESNPSASGVSHMVWTVPIGPSARNVYYAIIQDGQPMPAAGLRVSSFSFAESATYQSPVIGLEADRVYITWSVQNLGGGLTPTAADTFYISFAPGEARYTDPETLKIPADHRPDYDPHAGVYGISQLAPLSPDVYSTDYINAPAVVSGKSTELPVAVSLIIESASKQFMQLAVTILEDGEPIGYQIANETSNASVIPTVDADEEANLHLAWLDSAGFSRYNVYYATTAPDARAWLDRTTVEDVAERAASIAWGVLSAIGFLPLTVMWNAPALVWLVVFYLVAHQEHLDELAAKIALGVSFVLYLVVKALFLPGLLSSGTPFVYMVSEEWARALNTIIPVAILVLALIGIAVYVIRRRMRGGEPPSLFKAYMVFALIDSVLTAVLYAPRFFNPRG